MSSENVQVSVVIPTYNRAPYVAFAIKSVLNQSYKNYEIIVVDDGSTDGTRDVLEPYRDRIRYIYQDNKGVSAARNVGIQKAKGEWIAFLDSDDEWLPDKLEIQMMHIIKHPKICLHATNLTFFSPYGDEDDLFRKKGFDQVVGDFLLIERPLIYLLQYSFAIPSAVLAKKSLLIDAGLFDEGLSLHEDTDLFYRVSLKGPWGVCGLPLARKFRRNESLSLNLSDRHTDDLSYHYKVVVKILERLQQIKILTKSERCLVRQCLSYFYFMVGLALKVERKNGVRYWFYRGFRANLSLKIFIKWVLLNIPFVADLTASKLNQSKQKADM